MKHFYQTQNTIIVCVSNMTLANKILMLDFNANFDTVVDVNTIVTCSYVCGHHVV